MDPTRLMQLTATIAHAADGTPDEYNDATVTYSTVTARCWLQQTQRSEQTAAGQIETETWSLYLPAGTTIDPADQVTIDAVTYELTGPPWPAVNARTGQHSHIEATIRRVA